MKWSVDERFLKNTPRHYDLAVQSLLYLPLRPDLRSAIFATAFTNIFLGDHRIATLTATVSKE